MFHYVSNFIENFMKYEIKIADKNFRDLSAILIGTVRYITYKILRSAK